MCLGQDSLASPSDSHCEEITAPFPFLPACKSKFLPGLIHLRPRLRAGKLDFVWFCEYHEHSCSDWNLLSEVLGVFICDGEFFSFLYVFPSGTWKSWESRRQFHSGEELQRVKWAMNPHALVTTSPSAGKLTHWVTALLQPSIHKKSCILPDHHGNVHIKLTTSLHFSAVDVWTRCRDQTAKLRSDPTIKQTLSCDLISSMETSHMISRTESDFDSTLRCVYSLGFVFHIYTQTECV